MDLNAWLTLGVVGATVGLLAATRIPADLVLLGALTSLIVSDAVTPAQALAGFASPGLATVGILYVVASGLVNTHGVHAMTASLLGRPRTTRAAQLRLMSPVAALSSVLGNTPVVAMLVPIVEDWSKRSSISVSKLMIPLSYAAMLGGMCTAIGTSTNVIVRELMVEHTNLRPMGFFEIGALGLPCALMGVLFIVVAGRWLLPERKPPFREPAESREYVIEMLVDDDSPLIGKSVEEGGLRHLPGAFLAEIERGNSILPAVAPSERLHARDRLMFVGIVDSVVDLVRKRGLVPAPDQVFKLTAPRPERALIEVVVSSSFPLIGTSIREGQFRSRYNAVVIAVARNGERLRGKIGDVVLRPGDTLLLETRPSFLMRQRNSRDFLLVSGVQGGSVPRHDRAWLAGLILLGMVTAAATGLLSVLEAALVAAALMVVTRCTTGSVARSSIDWSALTAIGAALGIGEALLVTGAADAVTSAVLNVTAHSPWLTLAAVYVVTSLLTESITNNAAAVLVFPIALTAADTLGVSPWPFMAVVMIAASASFATPIGYQTNLMVYGPGGYRFSDYLPIGLPLNILLAAVVLWLAPIIWPFTQ